MMYNYGLSISRFNEIIKVSFDIFSALKYKGNVEGIRDICRIAMEYSCYKYIKCQS